MYHYTYRITNTKINKHYYGARSCKCHPKEDLGIKYFSSSTDKEFVKDQKANCKDFYYKILKIFKTRVGAIELEIELHHKFNVGINESFYNRAKQTNTGFDTTGTKLTEKQRKAISTMWKNKTAEEKKKIFSKNSTAEARKKNSDGLKRMYADPIRRKERIETIKKHNETYWTEENRNKNSEDIKKGFPKNISEIQSKLSAERYKDPEYKKFHKEQCDKANAISKDKYDFSTIGKEVWKRPEFREKMKNRKPRPFHIFEIEKDGHIEIFEKGKGALNGYKGISEYRWSEAIKNDTKVEGYKIRRIK